MDDKIPPWIQDDHANEKVLQLVGDPSLCPQVPGLYHLFFFLEHHNLNERYIFLRYISG